MDGQTRPCALSTMLGGDMMLFSSPFITVINGLTSSKNYTIYYWWIPEIRRLLPWISYRPGYLNGSVPRNGITKGKGEDGWIDSTVWLWSNLIVFNQKEKFTGISFISNDCIMKYSHSCSHLDLANNKKKKRKKVYTTGTLCLIDSLHHDDTITASIWTTPVWSSLRNRTKCNNL